MTWGVEDRVKDEKTTKMTKMTPRCPGCVRHHCLELLATKTVNAVSIKKAPARSPKSLAIFKLKRSGLTSQNWDHAAIHTAASVQDFQRLRRHKDDPLPALFARFFPRALFSLSQSEVSSWLASCCPWTASRRSVMGSSEPSLKVSSPIPFGGRWPCAKSMSISAVTRSVKVLK